MNIFKSRFASAIPLFSILIIATLHKFAERLGENYVMIAGITLLVLFLVNLGVFYTRYKEGRVAKSRIILLVLFMVVAFGAWAYLLFFP